ncbi:MAG: hypothetical protein HC780_29425 [Leptolyngbyaceae cyanobacterium CSU_1_3]|nr:hypothetical protein [Leptolyngbyaceae cyanobacterium CSU_1_3]
MNFAVISLQKIVEVALTSIPAGQLKLLFVDPLGLGQNAAMFMKLTNSMILGNKSAWGEPQHIEARLAELTEHMENVIQKYLRNEYADILAYNAQAPVPEPLRLVVIFDSQPIFRKIRHGVWSALPKMGCGAGFTRLFWWIPINLCLMVLTLPTSSRMRLFSSSIKTVLLGRD